MSTVKYGCVYALLFDDCHVYIGATTQPIQERMRQHTLSARNARTPLYQLWRKLGAPTPYVLYRCPLSQLAGLEAQAMRDYGTIGGLNVRTASPGLPVARRRPGWIYSPNRR